MGHELLHALGVLHPADCEAGEATCEQNALMWLGYEWYPRTHLRLDEKTRLIQSPFIRLDAPLHGELVSRSVLWF